MLRNLTIGKYLCFHKHRRTNITAYLNIYSRETFFLLKENSVIRFSYWNDDWEKFKEFRKNGGFDTARNKKGTSARIVYEKTVIEWKVFRGVFRTHSNIYDEAF